MEGKGRSHQVAKTKLIVNLTRGGAVCVGELADRPLARMRGLMGRSGLPAGEGLLLSPAPAIHTAFMRFPIDALFLDKQLRVVEVVERMPPWRIASERGARSVLELSAGESARRGVQVGDRLELRDRVPVASPGAAAVDDRAGAVRHWPSVGTRPLTRLQPLRILVVSPDGRFRTVMSLLLARRNCSVTATANAGRVGELIGREHTDVVVIDSGEPPFSGLIELRGLEPSVGVVVVADDPDPESGRTPILAKWGPFEELMQAIERAEQERHVGVGQP